MRTVKERGRSTDVTPRHVETTNITFRLGREGTGDLQIRTISRDVNPVLVPR